MGRKGLRVTKERKGYRLSRLIFTPKVKVPGKVESPSYSLG